MKIGVYATARNEAVNVADWCDTVADADVVAVNDSGSTDDTVALLRARGHDPTQWCPDPVYLKSLLNFSLGNLPDDVDIAVRVDFDERLPPGWRDVVEAAYVSRETSRPVCFWAWFDQGGCLYRHTRIHSRHGFTWIHPVHEELVDEAGERLTPRSTSTEQIPLELTIEHRQDLTKDRSQVLGELLAAHAADPANPRFMFYLSREYCTMGQWGTAIPWLRMHVRTKDDAWQRAESWRMLGDCYSADLHPRDVPAGTYLRAVTMTPQRRECWLSLAEYYERLGDHKMCLKACEEGLAITERHGYFNNPECWGPRLYELAASAATAVGKRDDAKRYQRQAREAA